MKKTSLRLNTNDLGDWADRTEDSFWLNKANMYFAKWLICY